jgi:hypothetical protein
MKVPKTLRRRRLKWPHPQGTSRSTTHATDPPSRAETATDGVIVACPAIDAEKLSLCIFSTCCAAGAGSDDRTCDLGDFSARAASRKTPSTGSGVMRRGGRGPRQLPTLGALDRHKPIGEAGEARLSRLHDLRTNTVPATMEPKTCAH